MKVEKLYLRKAVPSDKDMLFVLANDGAVRKNAFQTASISIDEHTKWFENMMEDDSQIQFILMLGDRAVGQIRLTIEENNAEIDYSIVPEKRGLGYGKKIVQLLKELIHSQYPSIQKLTAKVKPSNAASAYCFEENGFREIYEQYEFDMERYEVETGLTEGILPGGVISCT